MPDEIQISTLVDASLRDEFDGVRLKRGRKSVKEAISEAIRTWIDVGEIKKEATKAEDLTSIFPTHIPNVPGSSTAQGKKGSSGSTNTATPGVDFVTEPGIRPSSALEYIAIEKLLWLLRSRTPGVAPTILAILAQPFSTAEFQDERPSDLLPQAQPSPIGAGRPQPNRTAADDAKDGVADHLRRVKEGMAPAPDRGAKLPKAPRGKTG